MKPVPSEFTTYLPVKLNETSHVVPLPLSLTDMPRPVTLPLPSAVNIPTRSTSCRPVALLVVVVVPPVPPVPPLVLVELLPAIPDRLTAGCRWNEYEPCSAPLNVALLVVLPTAPPNCARATVLNDSAATITAAIASTLLLTLTAISIPPESL